MESFGRRLGTLGVGAKAARGVIVHPFPVAKPLAD